MDKKKEIVPRADNVYCPSCGTICQKGEKFCSRCGASLLKQKVKKTTESKEVKKKKSKKKIIILITIFVLLLITIGGALAWFYYNQKVKTNKDFEDKINSMWSEVIEKSNDFKDTLNDPTKKSDLDRLDKKAEDLEQLLKDKVSELDGVETPHGYQESKDKLKKGLEKYIDYLSNLQKNILDKDISRVKVSTDFDKVQKHADEARDALTDFIETSKYVEETISGDVFDLSQLKNFIKDWQSAAESEAEKESEKKSEEEKKAAEAAAKQAAEETCSDFMNGLPNAYGAADSWAEAQRIADQHWLTASMNNFRSDYKFYFEGGGVTYIGGQVISSDKVNNTKYNVSSEERERYHPHDDEPHEYRFLSYFIVEKFSSSWFITSHGRR